MNARTVKKVRKELQSKEKEMVNTVFDYFNSLSLGKRFKIAFKIIKGKL